MSVYEYTNPHPKGLRTSDCVVRAFAIAFDIDYLETRRLLNKTKRDLGFVSYKEKDFIYKFLIEKPRLIFKPVKGEPRIRATDFISLYPTGTYIVRMSKHIACIKNGKLLDTWDSSNKVIYTAWVIN